MNINHETHVGLDFETYGAVSLPDHGLQRYTEDKTFLPLIASTFDPKAGVSHFELARKPKTDINMLEQVIGERTIIAHNAGFERRVLQTMGYDLPASRFIDSAVIARAAGAGGSLEAAAPQLLGADKLNSGKDLIRLFSIPSAEQLESGDLMWDSTLPERHVYDWVEFRRYCGMDAELSYRLAQQHHDLLTVAEHGNQAVTMEMNALGWKVDVEMVEEMQRRYLENQARALEEFRTACDAADLNLNSLKQMKEWCADRGVRANSFDEKAVATLIGRIERKLEAIVLGDPKYDGYVQVLHLLKTKQTLGGSSLKKLQVILDTVGSDGRLKDQYLHIGAGQSWRTTGRSVQMQNLKRLAEPADMSELLDDDVEWTNTELAQNLRQVFTATHPQGALIVGDFSSVESRGLAWLAQEQWKLDAYRNGKDLYKVLAGTIFNTAYDDVTKAQRQAGKVGELSCGYNAGGGAVRSFAAGMGVEMTEAEATSLVFDWRQANPKIVKLWDDVHTLLLDVVQLNQPSSHMDIGNGCTLNIMQKVTPASLRAQHKGAQSIRVEMYGPTGRLMMTRIIHGCYMRGRNICYYKPSQRKTGDLWSSHYVDPKTKEVRFYSIYGGKLVGILTQSFCREIFFRVLRNVRGWVKSMPNVELVGQFHDEIVLDWSPGTGDASLSMVKAGLEQCMTDAGSLQGFPLAAEIKHDYRYTK